MDQFERQFEHLDVQTQTMDEAMSGATTLTVPEVLHLHSVYSYYTVNIVIQIDTYPQYTVCLYVYMVNVIRMFTSAFCVYVFL